MLTYKFLINTASLKLIILISFSRRAIEKQITITAKSLNQSFFKDFSEENVLTDADNSGIVKFILPLYIIW